MQHTLEDLQLLLVLPDQLLWTINMSFLKYEDHPVHLHKVADWQPGNLYQKVNQLYSLGFMAELNELSGAD